MRLIHVCSQSVPLLQHMVSSCLLPTTVVSWLHPYSEWSLCFTCNRPWAIAWCCCSACFLLALRLPSLTFTLQPHFILFCLSFQIFYLQWLHIKYYSFAHDSVSVSKWSPSAVFSENASIVTFIWNTSRSFPVLTFWAHVSFHWPISHTGLHVLSSWFPCLSV